MNRNPKATVLQEIMAMMDDQMLGRAKARKPQELPVETTNVTLGEEPTAPQPQAEDDGVDQETLQKLMQMQEDDEKVMPPNNMAGSY